MWITGDSPGRITHQINLIGLGFYAAMSLRRPFPWSFRMNFSLVQWGRKDTLYNCLVIIFKLFLCDLWHVTLRKTLSVFPSIIGGWAGLYVKSIDAGDWSREAGKQNLRRCSRQFLHICFLHTLSLQRAEASLFCFSSTLPVPPCESSCSNSALRKARPRCWWPFATKAKGQMPRARCWSSGSQIYIFIILKNHWQCSFKMQISAS